MHLFSRRRSAEPTPPVGKASLGTKIALLLVVATSAVVVAVALWWGLGRTPIQVLGAWIATGSFDFAKIVVGIVGGIGGVVALVVAYRKQRLKAAEQREHSKLFAENVTKATEQLGSKNAPVRLAGMYSLERLAQTPEQQQTVVNVLCAYLQMPYKPRKAQQPNGDSGAGASDGTTPNVSALYNPRAHPVASQQEDERREPEKQVRLAAQRILSEHLYWNNASASAEKFWADIDLDLTGAILFDFQLNGCHIRAARFDGAQFHGSAGFNEAHFHGSAGFNEAHFHGSAGFIGAQFHGDAGFIGAQFHEYGAMFLKAQFHGDAGFMGAQFHGDAGFDGAQFHSTSDFQGAQFHGNAAFDR